MIWIIFFVICVICLLLGYSLGWFDGYGSIDIFLWGFCVMCLLFSFVVISNGVYKYQEFLEQKEQIRTYELNISKIKNSYYKNKKGIDLINIQHSSSLSSYLQKYIELKAEYNGELKKAQYEMDKMVYIMFDHWFFADIDSIQELQILD